MDDEVGDCSALVSSPPEDASNVGHSEAHPTRAEWKDSKQFWKEKKQLSKQRKRESRQERAVEKQQQWEALSTEEQERMRAEAVLVHEARRREMEAHDDACKHQWDTAWSHTPLLVFDLGFLDVMNESGKKSTVAQLKYSYAILRREKFPFLPVFTSLDPQEPLFGPLATFEGFKKYPVPSTERHWSAPVGDDTTNTATSPHRLLTRLAAQRPLRKIVYLTADTDTILEEIEPDAAYIVGAFVDHNAKKGLTRDVALQYDVRMARLPLVETMEKLGNLCKVLTINHVTEAMCRYAATKDWKTAFAVLPTRRVNNAGSRQERKKRARAAKEQEEEEEEPQHSDDEERESD